MYNRLAGIASNDRRKLTKFQKSRKHRAKSLLGSATHDSMNLARLLASATHLVETGTELQDADRAALGSEGLTDVFV